MFNCAEVQTKRSSGESAPWVKLRTLDLIFRKVRNFRELPFPFRSLVLAPLRHFLLPVAAICAVAATSPTAAAVCIDLPCDADSLHALPTVRVHTQRRDSGKETKTLRFSQSGEVLQRLPGGTAADVLRTLPAVWVRSLGGYGAATTVGTRGLGAAHTAVMVDGFPLGDAENGAVDVARFAPQQLEALTIDVGDTPELLSPVHTLGAATLQFTTPQRPLRIWTAMGAFGYRSAGGSATLSTPIGQLGMQLNGERADNDYPFVFDNGASHERRRRTWAQTRHWTPALRWTLPTAARMGTGELGFVGHYSRRQLPGATLLYAVREGERMEDDDTALRGKWQIRRKAWRWRMAAQALFRQKRYEDRDRQYPNGVRQDAYRQREWWFSTGVEHRLSPHWAWAYAVDATWATLHQTGQAEREVERMSLQQALSLRYCDERLTATIRLLRHDLFNSARHADPTNPGTANDAGSFGLQGTAHAFLWRDRSTQLGLRAMAQSTFRPPTFAENYYFRYGNTQLRNERALRFNLGLIGAHQTVRWQLQASADAFVDRISDGIVAIPITPAIWRTENLDQVRATGIDFTASARYAREGGTTIAATGHWLLCRTVDRSKSSSRSYNLTLPYRPTHQGYFAVEAAHGAVGLSTSLAYTGERWSTPQHLAVSRLPGFAEWNASVWWKQAIGTSTLTLRATLMNLTDTQREYVRGYPLPGRTWTLNATFDL